MKYRFSLVTFLVMSSVCVFARQDKITIDHSWIAGDADWRIHPTSFNTNPPMLKASIGHTTLRTVSLICIDNCGVFNDGHVYQYVVSSGCSQKMQWSLNLGKGWQCIRISGGSRTTGVKECYYVMHIGDDITDDAKFPVLDVPQNIHDGQFRRW